MVPSVVVVVVVVVEVVAGGFWAVAEAVVPCCTTFQAAQLVEKWDVRRYVGLWCRRHSVRRAARAVDGVDSREPRVRDDERIRHARNMTVAVAGFILTLHLGKRKAENGKVERVVQQVDHMLWRWSRVGGGTVKC